MRALGFFFWLVVTACTKHTQGDDVGDISYVINVRLKEGYNIWDLFEVASSSVASSYKSIGLPKKVLDEMASNGMARSGKDIPNMNLWYTIELSPGVEPDNFLTDLEGNAAVDIAEKARLNDAPPSMIRGHPGSFPGRSLQTATPDFLSYQTYLNPAPQGIGAKYAWTRPGGTGAGVKVYDIEYAWNQNHEDLLLNVTLLTNGTPQYSSDKHGTAVLGELVGKNNGLGVQGICFDASVGLAPERTIEKPHSRADAILLSVDDGNPGDVILLEMQTWACNTEEYGPAEWSYLVFDATQTATANGFVVVAAAGNGNLNLDASICDDKFDLTVRDSGAIIVGAGNRRTKLGFSCYGSRVDAHGQGAYVYTTDFGSAFKDPDDTNNRNRWYTSQFSGTSSAAPMVAGAAVILQSYAATNHGRRLTPSEIRTILRTTGSPQEGAGGKIGPFPDLAQAMQAVDALLSGGNSSPTTKSPSSPTTKSPSFPTTKSPSSPTTKSPSSPTTKSPSSPTTRSPSSPTTKSPSSPTTKSPSSPTTKSPSSPTTKSPSSPTTKSPSSPTTNSPLSPTSPSPTINSPSPTAISPNPTNAPTTGNCAFYSQLVQSVTGIADKLKALFSQ